MMIDLYLQNHIITDLIFFLYIFCRKRDADILNVITGHRGVIRGAEEIKKGFDKYKSIIDKNDQRILSYFSETKPISVIDFKNRNIIYKYYSDFKEYEIVAEMIMVQKHFDKFLEFEIIQPKDNGFILS